MLSTSTVQGARCSLQSMSLTVRYCNRFPSFKPCGLGFAASGARVLQASPVTLHRRRRGGLRSRRRAHARSSVPCPVDPSLTHPRFDGVPPSRHEWHGVQCGPTRRASGQPAAAPEGGGGWPHRRCGAPWGGGAQLAVFPFEAPRPVPSSPDARARREERCDAADHADARSHGENLDVADRGERGARTKERTTERLALGSDRRGAPNANNPTMGPFNRFSESERSPVERRRHVGRPDPGPSLV